LIAAGALAVMLAVGVASFTSEPAAAANPCQHCINAQNACRVTKKGHSSCARKFEACMRQCLKPYRKQK